MPRNVRPSWLTLLIDGEERAATGPKSRTGELSALLKVRSAGGVLALLRIDAIGSNSGDAVQVTVSDVRNGKVLFTEAFSQ